MKRKLSEKELVDLLVDYVIANFEEASNPYEGCIRKTEEIAELVLKKIKEKLKE